MGMEWDWLKAGVLASFPFFWPCGSAPGDPGAFPSQPELKRGRFPNGSGLARLGRPQKAWYFPLSRVSTAWPVQPSSTLVYEKWRPLFCDSRVDASSTAAATSLRRRRVRAGGSCGIGRNFEGTLSRTHHSVLHRPAMFRFALGTALRSAARRQKTPPTCALQIRATPDQLRLGRQSIIPSLSFSSAPDMPPGRKRQTADKGGEDAQVTKKPRGDTTGAAKGLAQGTDAEGNPYWEVCFAPSLRVLSCRRIRSPFPTDWQQPAGQFVPVQGRHAGEHPRILHRARWRAETGKEGREPKKIKKIKKNKKAIHHSVWVLAFVLTSASGYLAHSGAVQGPAQGHSGAQRRAPRTGPRRGQPARCWDEQRDVWEDAGSVGEVGEAKRRPDE